LCDECEQWLGNAEGYLVLLSRGTKDELTSIGVTVTRGPAVDGVKPDLVRRAVLGILFKGHYASSPSWAAVQLDEKLVVGLRRRILADDFSEVSHPIMGIKWLSTRIPEANPRAMSTPSWRQRPGYTGFDVMMGGWSWSLILRGWSGMMRNKSFWDHERSP